MLRNIVGMLAGLGFLLSAPVNAVSFDCSKASSPYEKAVCSNPNLSSLDDQLAEAYKDARAKSSNSDSLKKDQIEWIKSTRTCGSDASCIETAYKTRLSQLKSAPASQNSSSVPKSGNLGDSELYAFFIKCNGPIRLTYAANKGSKDEDTWLNSVLAYKWSAEEIGRRLGYQEPKVTADLDASAKNYEKPYLDKNNSNNPGLMQSLVKKHEQEVQYCVNRSKDDKQIGDIFYKNYNKARATK